MLDLIELLDNNRVVKITEASGIGKTRLAIEICHRVNIDLLDDIFFISMADLPDAREITPIPANKLGLLESANRSLADGVYDILSDRDILLVLDNLEYVTSAAHEITELLAKCPRVSILCTSKTPLKISVEQEFGVLHHMVQRRLL